MVQVLTAPATGRLVAVTGLDEARTRPGVVRVELLAAPGRDVREGADMAGKLGYAILTGDSHADLRARATALLDTVRFDIDAPVGAES
jgi:hypothetical protein